MVGTSEKTINHNQQPRLITVPRGIPSAHMHWASISDLATLGMWADPGSYAWYVGGPRFSCASYLASSLLFIALPPNSRV